MSAFLSKKITRVSFILSLCIILYHATNTSVYAMTRNLLWFVESFLSTIISIATLNYLISPSLTFGIIIPLAFFLNKFLPKVFSIVCGGRTLPSKIEK